MTTIYHNPKCSKSRRTLSLLREHGIEPEIVLYLDTPIDADLINGLLTKLSLSAAELLRKSEPDYKRLGLSDKSLSNEHMINAMVQFPKLIERPVVVFKDRAVIGRPPEKVLELI